MPIIKEPTTEDLLYDARENNKKLKQKIDKYKQTLEEIRKEANRLLYEENPIYGYNNSNYFELLVKYVLAKTEEVLK